MSYSTEVQALQLDIFELRMVIARNANPVAFANYEELQEIADFMGQQIGEMAAENAGEVAMFGDSGPGSALVLRRMERKLDTLLVEIATLASGLQVPTWEACYADAVAATPTPTEEEPF